MTTPLPQMRSLLNTLICALLAVTMLAACSGEEAEPPKAKKSDSAPVVPDLEAAWSSDTVDPAAVREVVRVEDLVILEERGLTALDAATGALAWHLDGADVCTSSERAVDGLFVIGYRPKGGRGADQCPVLAAVDVSTGTIAWQRRIGGISGDERGGPGLAVGERVISVKSELCGPMRRYDLRTGKVLAPFRQVQNDDYACDDWAINDHLVAQLETPDFGYRNFLSLHDTDTGKRIFRRRFPDGSLQAIVSTDPLVLDVTEKGHRLMWTVDPADGRLVTPISPQFSALGEGMQTVGIDDGVVVVAGQSTRNVASSLSGLDLSGGPVRWSGFPSSGSLAGLDQGLIVLSSLTTSAGPRSVVTRHRFSDVADPEVLGAVTTLVTRGVAGDLLIVDGPADGGGARKGVTALRLPAPGEGPDVGDIDLTWDEPAGGVAVDEDGWQKGEVRPEDVETCPVTEATLATLGFHRLDLPRPVGCDWSERREPRGVNRHLDARTWVATPLPPEYVQSGDSPKATDRAHAEVQRILEQTMVPGARGGLDAIGKRVVDLPGVGDEAHVVYGAGLGGRYGNVSILVRVANVVVHVVMEVITDPYDVVGATLPDHLEAGAWSAVEELFAGAGLSVERPIPASPAIDEPTLRPQPALCRALAPSVAGLVPGVRGTDLRRADDEEKRMAGCSWDTSSDASGNHDGVQVGIYATPSSVLTGTSGTKLARQAFRYTAKTHDFADHERPVAGLGDQARVVSWDVTWLQGRIGQAKKWTAAQAYARSGNVTVVAVVQYRGLSTAALEERAIALVRETLATQKP